MFTTFFFLLRFFSSDEKSDDDGSRSGSSGMCSFSFPSENPLVMSVAQNPVVVSVDYFS